jgi:hypothetical protein
VSAVVARLSDTSAQIRVRLAVLLVVGLGAVAEGLGFEAILGAFLAGLVLRRADPDGVMSHPHFREKLDGIGFGFVVPVFFVTSGLVFDVDALRASPGALLQVPVFLAALLVVRALPALAYRSVLTGREVMAAGLLQATSLPFLVVGAALGLELGVLGPGDAAALVAAGLLSVVLFPALALRVAAPRPLLTRSRPGEPGMSVPVAVRAHEEQQAAAAATTPEPAADRHADAALVERLRAGDEAAFADLVDRWSPSLLRVAVLQTRSHALAEEAGPGHLAGGAAGHRRLRVPGVAAHLGVPDPALHQPFQGRARAAGALAHRRRRAVGGRRTARAAG